MGSLPKELRIIIKPKINDSKIVSPIIIEKKLLLPEFNKDNKIPSSVVPTSTSSSIITNNPNNIKEDSSSSSQEKRDIIAKETKEKYIKYKNIAKEKEKKAIIAKEDAIIARNYALNIKKQSQIAIGDACKTRIGGRFLCLRPFNIGY